MNPITSAAQAQERFGRMLAQSAAIAELAMVEMERWEKKRLDHIQTIHVAVWAVLACVGAAVMADAWWSWAIAAVVIITIACLLIVHCGEHSAERMAHEVRMRELEQRRAYALMRFGPEN